MSIKQFYTNQEIFITGGSGFIGKALIEKLLRSLPNIGKIYVLIRSRKGKSAEERLREILETPLFRRVREEQPAEIFKKVVAIPGDCQELGLGISSTDLEKIRNVSIIFHAAASVRFDDHLKPAILLNTRGTHELVKIAEGLPNLKAFVHVSTTYAYPNMHVLDEKIYPAYADWRTTIKLAETYDMETLNVFFSKYSLDQPNTYTFTKSLAEHIIDEYRHKLPMAIFRPSIVISSLEEPFPGWIDNFNGPIGMLVACGVGIMRTNHANPDVTSDFIPVDFCIKTLLISAYKLSTQPTTDDADADDQLQVLNCSNSNLNAITTGELIAIGKKVVLENPFEKCIWFAEGDITRCAVWHYIRFIFTQIFPAILLDFLMSLARHPPFLLKLQRRIHATNNALAIFINTEWTFINNNTLALENIIENEEDLLIFGFLRYLNCDRKLFIANGLKGAKEFLLKENPEASNAARLRVRIFQVLHYTIEFVGIYYLARYILSYLYAYVNSQ